MQYDPIKRVLGKAFNRTPFLRKVFYSLLDMLLLRAWHVSRELKKWGKSHTGKELKILDAGSGFGQYTYRMSRLFPKARIKGVDVKEEQIADCNQFFNRIGKGERVHFAEADLTKFDEPETYDLILSVDVMEHILEDEQVFRNFNASLKPGGVLFISTPSDQGGSDSHDHEHEEDVHGFIDEHVRDGYGVADIREKLERAGFTNIDVRYTYGAPGKISWRLSMKYPIQMLGASKIFFVVLPFYYLVAYPVSALLNYFDVHGKHETGTGLMVKAEKPV
ncbi:class I SAM-dependent methyltransferase [Prolixibacter sp. NT017]|uniref:class I SAM-dependent methyltransferase n=1 Tax=Prolixibacter sp. NT017 TaxID=2652390 RepID=UPI001289F7E1|nr:class I SAM-dependent methyltransferase [Prolixibacter sp. NT017]GET27088.1 methyltransferase type 11 [Prolixibacter sp. NT017]